MDTVTLAASIPVAFAFSDILAIAAILFGAGGVITVIVDKVLRKPSDRQAEIEFSVNVLKELLQEQRDGLATDRARWLDQERFLRDELGKADKQDQEQRERIERIEKLLEDARERIAKLASELDLLRQRISDLAVKHAHGEAIELADILGRDGAERFLHNSNMPHA